ncbi:hypothetical protein MY04_2734 [Flammeovirga sp. MY04]|uniref:hypothetical protein n=1 Tax=Flammeovirga sp. MY04 TaxID=1191459 RepID=UPI0008064018|nr:hypothetical protein [Flammeovirga sp. MY04]ANQ50103.1 hypothetical protein MY04_2734 [Flammeovirga sp. MY04]
MQHRLLFILVLFVSLQSCVLLDEHVPADEVKVEYKDQDALKLKPMVDRYIQEASKRNVFFKNKKVTIHTTSYSGINGKGNPMTSNVNINKTSKNWEKYMKGDEAAMLSTVSHELCHALLGYHHRGNGKLEYHGELYRNSIMTSTNWGVPSLDKENNEIWEYYYDELFRVTDIQSNYEEISANGKEDMSQFDVCEHHDEVN